MSRPKQSEILGKQKQILDNLGVNKPTKVFHYFGFVLTFASNALCIITLSSQLIIDWGDFTKMLDSLFVLTQMITYGAKLLNFTCNRKILSKLLLMLEDIFMKDYDEKYDGIFQRKIKQFYIMDMVYRVAAYAQFLISVFYVIWEQNPEKPLFFTGYFVVDPWEFQYWILAVQTVIYMTCICADITLDLFHCGLMSLAAGHFEILGDQLANLGYGNSTEGNFAELDFAKGDFPDVVFEEYDLAKSDFSREAEDFEERELMEKLRYCVEKHLYLLEFTQRLGILMPYGLLVQFGGSILIICVSGIVVFLASQRSLFESMTLLNFMFCMFFEISVYCWFGNELIIKSSHVGSSCYASGWYNQSPRARKLLMLMMERTKRPVMIKAANFVILSLGTLAIVLSKAYSYFTLLQSVLKK